MSVVLAEARSVNIALEKGGRQKRISRSQRCMFYYFTSNYGGMSLQNKVGGRGWEEVKDCFSLTCDQFLCAMHQVHRAGLA